MVMHRDRPLSYGHENEIHNEESVVVALVLGVAGRGRLRSALRDRHYLHFVERVAELEHLVTTTTGVIAALLVEARDIDGRSVSDVVTRISSTESAPPVV